MHLFSKSLGKAGERNADQSFAVERIDDGSSDAEADSRTRTLGTKVGKEENEKGLTDHHNRLGPVEKNSIYILPRREWRVQWL